MSINYQELVPEKALGKEISRHIFQSYRAKTGLPHEIDLRYSIYDTAGVYGHKKALKANYNKAYTPIIVTPDRPLYAKYAKYYLFARLAIRILGDKLAAHFK